MVGVTPTNLWPYTLDFPACLAPILNRHFYFKSKLGLGTPLPKFARLSPGFAVLSFALAAEPNPGTAKNPGRLLATMDFSRCSVVLGIDHSLTVFTPKFRYMNWRAQKHRPANDL